MDQGRYYDRDRLYEEVWSEPVDAVAKRYGVSGNALGATCRRLGVPVPGRGYWAKRLHGQSPPRPPLPDFKNPPRIARRQVWHQTEETARPTRLRPDVYDAAQKLIQAERSPENQIIVADEYDHYPPLVEAARSRCWKPGVPYGNPQRPPEPPKPTRQCFDICVSTTQADRAFRLMTALSQALEKRGFRITVGELWNGHWPTLVSILGTQVAFSLTESHKRRKLDEHERKPRSYEYYVWESTGIFTLEIAGIGYGRGRARWNDTRRKPIEKQLNAFVAGLIEAAATEVETTAQRDRERKRKLVGSDAKRRRSYRNQRESIRIAAIERGADQWDHYLRVTRYIAAVEQAAPDVGLSDVEEVRRTAWLRWARAYAESCNPLRTGHPTLRVEPTEIERHDPIWFQSEYPRLRESGLGRTVVRDGTW